MVVLLLPKHFRKGNGQKPGILKIFIDELDVIGYVGAGQERDLFFCCCVVIWEGGYFLVELRCLMSERLELEQRVGLGVEVFHFVHDIKHELAET